MKNKSKNNVAIIIGSDSDLNIAEKSAEVLKKLNINYEIHIISAHRTPERAREFAKSAHEKFNIIIAIAGKAAHLAGVLASYTLIPVIGVPVKSDDLGGLDALLSTVQMPSGIPVAAVAINGGANAAWLGARILALNDEELFLKLQDEINFMNKNIIEKDKKLNGQL